MAFRGQSAQSRFLPRWIGRSFVIKRFDTNLHKIPRDVLAIPL